MTPGVYIEEKNAFPSSAVAVETAVPAFIGYTEVAQRNGKSLLHIPTKITSFAEYVERFGGGFRPKYQIVDADPTIKQDTFMIDGANKTLQVNDNNTAYMYNSIRLFYANGGGPAYIISVGTYKDAASFEIKGDDFIGTETVPDPLVLLEKEYEPTLIVMPDAIKLGTDCYTTIYQRVLEHCSKMQSRFGIFDLVRQKPSELTSEVIDAFRNDIGINALNYGAAYYPWLKSAVVQPSEVDFENIDSSFDLSTGLPELKAQEAAKKFKSVTLASTTMDALGTMVTAGANTLKNLQAALAAEKDDAKKADIQKKIDATTASNKVLTDTQGTLTNAQTALTKAQADLDGNKDATKAADLQTALDAAKKAWNDAVKAGSTALNPKNPTAFTDLAAANYQNAKTNFHQALKASSPTYNNILDEIRAQINELPPSGAMAGLYTMVDNSRGVWKSPANISVTMVNAPSVNISNEGQEQLNVDVMGGKSVNVIRAFPGIGTLVWGGRTLDGNSQDWRYINVRRTMIMIEQSLKLACRAYVFEPNDANTWITVKSMISNFLTNLWKQGALAGAVPEQAFDVQIGLGATMTATDILDGKMLITVKVAVVRPAEFIVITFQQQMQQS